MQRVNKEKHELRGQLLALQAAGAAKVDVSVGRCPRRCCLLLALGEQASF